MKPEEGKQILLFLGGGAAGEMSFLSDVKHPCVIYLNEHGWVNSISMDPRGASIAVNAVELF